MSSEKTQKIDWIKKLYDHIAFFQLKEKRIEIELFGIMLFLLFLVHW